MCLNFCFVEVLKYIQLSTTFSFLLGQVIKAWDIGVATMKKGEICHLLCKPEYAYGSAGSLPKIPSNATLFFEASMCVMSLCQHLLYTALAPKRQAVQGGAKLAIESRIQLIYFGAWLLELFPTNPRGVCQCFLRNVSLAQNGHIQINKRNQAQK